MKHPTLVLILKGAFGGFIAFSAMFASNWIFDSNGFRRDARNLDARVVQALLMCVVVGALIGLLKGERQAQKTLPDRLRELGEFLGFPLRAAYDKIMKVWIILLIAISLISAAAPLIRDTFESSSGVRDSLLVFAAILVLFVLYVLWTKWRNSAWTEVYKCVGKNLSMEPSGANGVRGSFRDATVTVFHWEHKEDKGTSAVFVSPSHQIPEFCLRPENDFMDNFSLFGQAGLMEDIDFKQDAEFSQRFYIQGNNDSDVRKLFPETTRATFMKLFNKSKHLHNIIGSNGSVTVTSKRPLKTSASLISFIRDARVIYDLLTNTMPPAVAGAERSNGGN